ncbi:MAG: hypothetical protein CL843_09150 [Crocinitomicaceae bacterium]|nr:hypothetical protein [Crocinitomicaceae bacterium]|tara:strand:+ start:5706 stop:6320 length:615 start_codon:yes stop_codon:yes gene_type:complete
MEKIQIVTNGKVIVAPDITIIEFKEIIEEVLNPNLQEFTGKDEIYFTYVEEPFPCYTIPEGITYNDLIEIIGREYSLKYRAINQDDFLLEGTRPKEYNHTLTIDELKGIADQMCEQIDQKDKLEIEKKLISKRLGDQITELDSNIHDLSVKHRMGFETRESNCKVRLNFKDGMKYYYDAESDELITSEELTSDDFQLRIDYQPL